jgi:hypothetical protein
MPVTKGRKTSATPTNRQANPPSAINRSISVVVLGSFAARISFDGSLSRGILTYGTQANRANFGAAG